MPEALLAGPSLSPGSTQADPNADALELLGGGGAQEADPIECGVTRWGAKVSWILMGTPQDTRLIKTTLGHRVAVSLTQPLALGRVQ